MSEENFEDEVPEGNTLFQEYCENTSIHGVRYFGETYRPRMERIFWAIIFIISFFFCAKLTYKVFHNWQNHPVIISFEDKSTAIGFIPFPAITLCPNNRYNRRDYNFSFFDLVDIVSDSNVSNVFEENGGVFDALSLVCMSPKKLLQLKETKLSYSSTDTIVQNLNKFYTNFDEIFQKCYWKEKEENCRQIFSKSLTASGICYTFNNLGYEQILREEVIHPDYVLEKAVIPEINWTPELSYGNRKENETKYPWSVLSAGVENGLSMHLIGSERDIDIYCGGLVTGFTMVLHSPNELPQTLGNYIRIPFDQDTLVAIKPNMKTTSPELKSYSPQKRQCYFSDERYLSFFKIYTQNNCEIECLANYTIKACKCVSFFLPRYLNTPVCVLEDTPCILEAYKNMTIAEAEGGDCNCLAGCSTISYDMEVSQAEIVNKKNSTGLDFDLYGTVTLFFKEDQFWTSKRNELYNVVDIIANVGGVLGLFMGVSIISVVEIIYYLLIYFCRRYCKSKQAK